MTKAKAATKGGSKPATKAATKGAPVKPQKPASVAPAKPPAKAATKGAPAKPKKPTPKQDPIALDNGRAANPAAMRAALATYAPGEKIPESDREAYDLLLARVNARVDALKADAIANDLPEETHLLLCGDGDTPTDGCRKVCTNDLSDYCPFCGEDFDPAVHGVVAQDAAAEASKVEIVTATDAGLDVQRAELSEAMNRYRSFAKNVAENCYDIGLTLRDISERELWKAAGADSFKAFVEKELALSKTSAYRYMELTKNYTRETFISVGTKKLEIISGMPSEERAAALEAAANGASARELAAGAHERTQREDAPARERRETTAPAKGKNDITLIGKVNGKPQVVGFRSGESGRPIKTWKPGAYVDHHIADDVVVRILMKEVKGSPGEFEGVTIALIRAED
jgi:hypothetical protein